MPEAASIDAFAIQGERLYCAASGPCGTALWRTGRIAGQLMIQEWEIVRPPMERPASIPVSGVAGSVSSAGNSTRRSRHAPWILHQACATAARSIATG